MRRIAFLLVTVLLTAVLFASGIGTATAEPQKNQIRVLTQCDNGKRLTFVVNGEGNVGQIIGSRNNIVIQRSKLTFLDPETRVPVADPAIVDQGNKKGLQGDLIICKGEITTDIFMRGEIREVTVVFEFQGFITPRGNR